MNWDRVDQARHRARSMFLVAGFAILIAVLLLITPPGDPSFGPPPPMKLVVLSTLVMAIGIGGVIFGLAWMWRIYRAPTKVSSPRWRYRDRR